MKNEIETMQQPETTQDVFFDVVRYSDKLCQEKLGWREALEVQSAMMVASIYFVEGKRGLKKLCKGL